MTNYLSLEQSGGDPVKEATLVTLQRLLDPLLALMLDTGITVQELNKMAREQAVRIAASRIFDETGRNSKSRVSIMTGLPRSEVTKILDSELTARSNADQHPARRVLARWFDSPFFSDLNGQPAILPIFGKTRSFQKLVSRFGGGIPVRAMLDELTKMDAIERLPQQKIRAKARVPVIAGLSIHYGSVVDAVCALDSDRKGTVENVIQHTQSTALKGLKFELHRSARTPGFRPMRSNGRAAPWAKKTQLLAMFAEVAGSQGAASNSLPLFFFAKSPSPSMTGEYSIDRGQRFQAIMDSAAKWAASAADSSQVSTMG